MWNLEKWYRQICLQHRNRDADLEKGHVDTGERRVGEGRINWETSIDIYTLPRVKCLAGGNLLYSTRSSAQWSLMTEMDGVGGRGRMEVQEGVALCIHIADSLHCTA